MSEYDIAFGGKLIEAARYVANDDLNTHEAVRTVLYLSKLACEIILKSLLEKAGKPVGDIKKRSHSLSALSSDLAFCEIQKTITPSRLLWVSAADLFGGRATVFSVNSRWRVMAEPPC